MATARRTSRRLRLLGRWVWDHYVPIFMAYLPLQAFANFAAHWDHPDYGFSRLGLGVFLTCLFPVNWLLVYVFCGVIARRNRLVTEMRGQLEHARRQEPQNEGEVDHDDRRRP